MHAVCECVCVRVRHPPSAYLLIPLGFASIFSALPPLLRLLLECLTGGRGGGEGGLDYAVGAGPALRGALAQGAAACAHKVGGGGAV